jgi:hypothetical protein
MTRRIHLGEGMVAHSPQRCERKEITRSGYVEGRSDDLPRRVSGCGHQLDRVR